MSVVTQGLGSIRILTSGYSEAFANLIPAAPSRRWQDATNRYTLVNLYAPDQEPVSIDEMRRHAKIDSDDEDEWLQTAISAARAEAENKCNRVFVTQTWVLSMDRFPSYGYVPGYNVSGDQYPGPVYSVLPYARGFSEFPLPISPVQSIESITYLDSAGVRRSIDPLAFDVDNTGYPATVTPIATMSWPGVTQGRGAVQITFLAGYGEPAQVPAGIKQWIKIKVATAFRNRESVVLFRGTIQELDYVDRLLDPYRLAEVA